MTDSCGQLVLRSPEQRCSSFKVLRLKSQLLKETKHKAGRQGEKVNARRVGSVGEKQHAKNTCLLNVRGPREHLWCPHTEEFHSLWNILSAGWSLKGRLSPPPWWTPASLGAEKQKNPRQAPPQVSATNLKRFKTHSCLLIICDVESTNG